MTFKYISLFFRITAFALITFSANAEPLKLITAEYQGKYSGMVIKSERTLVKTGDTTYEFHSKIKNFLGNIHESSYFNIDKHTNLVPNEYRYKRKIAFKSSHQKIVFDWEQNRAFYTRKKQPEKNKEHRIAPKMLDMALYQLNLQRDLANKKSDLKYVIVKPNKIKVMEFALKATERIELMDSSYEGIKVERVNLDDSAETTIWVIPELNYQIGRIDHKDKKGDEYQIMLSSYEANKQQLTEFYALNP